MNLTRPNAHRRGRPKKPEDYKHAISITRGIVTGIFLLKSVGSG